MVSAVLQFGPFRAVVDAILAQDETAPRKQRHTASQVFRRLRATYGYAGGYTLFLPIRQAARIYSCRGLGTIEQELLGPRSPRWALIPPDSFPGQGCAAVSAGWSRGPTGSHTPPSYYEKGYHEEHDSG
jgi:hypothetical protein